jgi:phage-related minor tail protein
MAQEQHANLPQAGARSMTKTISQREARALRRRVRELEQVLDRQQNAWAESWPGGVNIETFNTDSDTVAKIQTARLLKHACVAVVRPNGDIAIYALPLGSKA